MNKISRTITGVVMILLGLALIITGFFSFFITWIYGVPIFIIGIVILFNKNEDYIEQRKDELNSKGGKK